MNSLLSVAPPDSATGGIAGDPNRETRPVPGPPDSPEDTGNRLPTPSTQAGMALACTPTQEADR